MGDDDPVRVDAIDLSLGDDTAMRVIVDDADVRRALRAELADHLLDRPAPLGFVLRTPTDAGGLHLVLDRTGFVLGRSRDIADATAILRRHLGALAPPAPDTNRYRLRAVVAADGGSRLVAFPLLTEPAAVERRLARAGARVVDAVCVDLGVDDSGGVRLHPPAGPRRRSDRDVRGHLEPPHEPLAVSGLLCPAQGPVTRAHVVERIADADVAPGDRDRALDRAEAIAALPTVDVEVGDDASLYRALDAMR